MNGLLSILNFIIRECYFCILEMQLLINLRPAQVGTFDLHADSRMDSGINSGINFRVDFRMDSKL